MKRLFTILLAVLSAAGVFAQSPNKMSYQAVIRNSSDALITNTQIGMEINIRQGSPTGSIIYTETQTPTTNANGLVSLEIGGTGFNAIDWSAGPYFMETKTAVVPPLTTYTITGTCQLLSVPYALHAKTAESINGGINETDPVFAASPANGILSGDISNWNTAYGWGNHATAGYLTSFTETDPLWSASPSSAITNTNISDWNTAFAWGNHATAGYLTSYTETDPLWSASPSSGITNTNISDWNTAFGWGNHATAGYLTSFTETDPLWSASPSSAITNTNIGDWNTAFGWGDHAGLYKPAAYVPAWSEITSNPFSFSAPADNQLIRYNAVSGKWENWTSSFLTAEIDGSVTNEIELPNQIGESGKFLTTDGTSPAWSSITKSTVGLNNVENVALSTWTGSSSLTTLGTVSSGVWNGTVINASYIDNLPASKITSGIFDNARINWAAPGNIGTTTPATGSFTALSASSGLNVSAGTVTLKPLGSGGTNGQVLTTDGSGNATWQSGPGKSIRTVTSNVTLTSTDEVIIMGGAYTVTFPATPANGQVLMICGTNASASVNTNGKTLRVANSSNAAGTYSLTDMSTNLAIFIYESATNTWHANF